jgi:hypothetical protein
VSKRPLGPTSTIGPSTMLAGWLVGCHLPLHTGLGASRLGSDTVACDVYPAAGAGFAANTGGLFHEGMLPASMPSSKCLRRRLRLQEVGGVRKHAERDDHLLLAVELEFGRVMTVVVENLKHGLPARRVCTQPTTLPRLQLTILSERIYSSDGVGWRGILLDVQGRLWPPHMPHFVLRGLLRLVAHRAKRLALTHKVTSTHPPASLLPDSPCLTGRWRIKLVAGSGQYHDVKITANLWGWSCCRGKTPTQRDAGAHGPKRRSLPLWSVRSPHAQETNYLHNETGKDTPLIIYSSM